MTRRYWNLTEEQRVKIREKKRYKYASQSVGYNEHQEVPNEALEPNLLHLLV